LKELHPTLNALLYLFSTHIKKFAAKVDSQRGAAVRSKRDQHSSLFLTVAYIGNHLVRILCPLYSQDRCPTAHPTNLNVSLVQRNLVLSASYEHAKNDFVKITILRFLIFNNDFSFMLPVDFQSCAYEHP